MVYTAVVIGFCAAYLTAYCVSVRFQLQYIASINGITRYRREHFCCCERLLKSAFGPLIFLHFLTRRRFWLESRLLQMQSADIERAEMLPVFEQIGRIGGLAIWQDDLVSISFMRRPVTDEQLSIVWLFTPLRDLDLSHTLVTDDGIKLIRQLPNLEFVDLLNTPISDD